MAKNIFMLRRKQLIFGTIFLVLIYKCLGHFRDYTSLPIRRGEKFFYCVVINAMIGVLLFGLKVTLAYDPFLNDPFKEGAFQCTSNEVMPIVWFGVLLSIWIVFFLVRVQFVYQLAIILLVSLLVIWGYYSRELYRTRISDKGKHMMRVLCGLNERLNHHEQMVLQNLGYCPSNRILGFGTNGTTYKCGDITKNRNLVLKVIDITEWQRNRTPDTKSAQRARMAIEQIRNGYLNCVRKLRAMHDKNVMKFVKIHNEAGTFHRIYMITPLAEMNLDTFFTDHKPNGVPEQWARQWFGQICSGLFYLHEVFDSEPFAHSNIKPENILLFRKKVPDSEPDSDKKPFHFGRTDDKKDGIPKANSSMRDQYVLKLADCGFNSFLPLGGKVITKRNPIIMISPPKRVVGKRYLRILNESQKNDEKKFDDIYQMGVVLLLLLKGDIHRLLNAPKDTERIHNEVTGVDAVYVRLDRPDIHRKLIGDTNPNLNLLLRKMMEWEPLLRYGIKEVIDSEWMKAGTQSTSD